MSTIYDQRYIKLIEQLVAVRKGVGITQEALAEALQTEQSKISKVESLDRRIDIMELYDWLAALGYSHRKFLEDAGWMTEEVNTSLPAIPVPGKAQSVVEAGSFKGTNIQMAWQGKRKDVFIAGLPTDMYLALEDEISKIYKKLNHENGGKNRDAIFHALNVAITRFPDVNPSDIYHHIIYRIYLREYTKTQADRSWVRAGGEAFELFLETHYNRRLNPKGIFVKWLLNEKLRVSALQEMGIQSEVGGSKLDIALYGQLGGRMVAFGGIHAKASLAERVSDDVPCSVAMMRKGLSSFLVTLDAKSYPLPTGDLVNRGELGSIVDPTDKRAYIEAHGSFDACFSYNLRSVASGQTTKSGKRIYVSTFSDQTDSLPRVVEAAWKTFSKRNDRS
jgi:transcriptional regulator with XRE-family HTH domain